MRTYFAALHAGIQPIRLAPGVEPGRIHRWICWVFGSGPHEPIATIPDGRRIYAFCFCDRGLDPAGPRCREAESLAAEIGAVRDPKKIPGANALVDCIEEDPDADPDEFGSRPMIAVKRAVKTLAARVRFVGIESPERAIAAEEARPL